MFTKEIFEENITGDVYKDIQYAQSFYPVHPEIPTKPPLKKDFTSTELEAYAPLLKKYEEDKEAFREKINKYREEYSAVNSIIEDYIKKDAGLFTYVPENKRDKVWRRAWDEGHSSGYYEVYLCLCSLVDLFDDTK